MPSRLKIPVLTLEPPRSLAYKCYYVPDIAAAIPPRPFLDIGPYVRSLRAEAYGGFQR